MSSVNGALSGYWFRTFAPASAEDSGNAAHAGQRQALPRSDAGTSDSARRLTTTVVHQQATSKEPLAAGAQ
jgi:hypothetical protein